MQSEQQMWTHELANEWAEICSCAQWAKGRIICEWWDITAGPSADQFAQLIGGITATHVAQLRAVWLRFSTDRFKAQYRGLRWAHFYAALEWPDAEKWLDLARRFNWDPGKMRMERWAIQQKKKADA